MNITSIIMVLKVLDAIHDYLLCPVFGDKSNDDLEKVMEKLTDIETLILQLKGGGEK